MAIGNSDEKLYLFHSFSFLNLILLRIGLVIIFLLVLLLLNLIGANKYLSCLITLVVTLVFYFFYLKFCFGEVTVIIKQDSIVFKWRKKIYPFIKNDFKLHFNDIVSYSFQDSLKIDYYSFNIKAKKEVIRLLIANHKDSLGVMSFKSEIDTIMKNHRQKIH